ncbi:MAG: glutaredoxin family protein [Candidatus Dormibacteria bacterium]
MSELTVYGTSWCPDCHRSKAFLNSHRIAFAWVDIDEDKQGRAEVERLQNGGRTVPTIVFADGTCLLEPSDEALATKLGIAV